MNKLCTNTEIGGGGGGRSERNIGGNAFSFLSWFLFSKSLITKVEVSVPWDL